MFRKFRLNVQLLAEILVLLALTLGVLAYFSHKVLKREAMRNASLMLDATVQDIDNILLSVEQSTGNIYLDLLQHLDNPQRMFTYSREIVVSNPNIVGCAIAFKPGYYPGKDLFMAYIHRRAFANDVKSDLVTTEMFANRPYTEQIWYTESMKTGWIGWTDPLKGDDTENEPLVNFCLPITDKNGERVGVVAVDVSISQLSKIVLAAKPSENGYSVLLARNGSFIVHPNVDKLESQTVFSQMDQGADASVLEAAEAMVAGHVGEKDFKMDGKNWTVFFKPFVRGEWEGRYNGEGTLGWSVGVVYPDEDIFGIHNKLVFLVIVIAFVGILAFFLLCTWILRRQLKPLRKLTNSAQRIANGDLNEELNSTDRDDEIGHLQNRFRKMQKSLQNQIRELEQETAQLHQRSDVLRAAYGNTEDADRMKTSFLHYMTNQMSVPTESIDRSVTTLCNNYHDLSKEEIEKQVDNIQLKSDAIVDLLNHMIHFTETDQGKEARNE